MDFLDPSQKHIHSRRLFISYALIGIIIALLSALLLVLAYGWGVQRSAGKITVIRNGLVFVSSYPVSADVYVDGAKKSSTPLRLDLPFDEYSFELKQPGYRDWKRTLQIEGGVITRLNYPFLFPTNLVTTDTQLLKTPPKMATQSIDNNWLITQSAEKFTSFVMYDLSQKTPVPQPFSLPNGLLTTSTGAQTLSEVEWASDNRHVLLKHSYKGGNEFIVLDIQKPSSSINLNTLFKTDPTSVTLQNKHFDKYYFYDTKAQLLSEATIANKPLQPILSGVSIFKPEGDNVVVYSTVVGVPKGKIAVKIWDGKQSYLIDYYNLADGIDVDIANYSSSDYLTVSLKLTGQTLVYKNPLRRAKNNQTINLLTTLRLSQNSYTSFSNNNRFIVTQNGSNFAVYDIEVSKPYYFQVPFIIPTTLKVGWMDNYRLNLVLNSKTIVFDFDGSNLQTLTSSLTGFIPYFNKDYTVLYNLAPSVLVKGSYALTNTPLKVANQ